VKGEKAWRTTSRIRAQEIKSLIADRREDLKASARFFALEKANSKRLRGTKKPGKEKKQSRPHHNQKGRQANRELEKNPSQAAAPAGPWGRDVPGFRSETLSYPAVGVCGNWSSAPKRKRKGNSRRKFAGEGKTARAGGRGKWRLRPKEKHNGGEEKPGPKKGEKPGAHRGAGRDTKAETCRKPEWLQLDRTPGSTRRRQLKKRGGTSNDACTEM